uniref:Uncharacterized protein n=1 Tax=Caenorhabditis japonica TaxID=281687 RepID=A0A8R1E421_CAEJA
MYILIIGTIGETKISDIPVVILKQSGGGRIGDRNILVGGDFISNFSTWKLTRPYWKSVTLVFSIGIFVNIVQFVENQGHKGSYGSDFRMVTSASTIIFLYSVVFPLRYTGSFGIAAVK